ALQNVVLVAMTGYGMESDRQRSREAGFDHHLVKPASQEDLRKIFGSVNSRRLSPAAASGEPSTE
ncbi:MAG: hybrid sensor histidine kinase/response regulator, partial [Dehalococcoidia bacterium]